VSGLPNLKPAWLHPEVFFATHDSKKSMLLFFQIFYNFNEEQWNVSNFREGSQRGRFKSADVTRDMLSNSREHASKDVTDRG
jgi:hypothetical protein